MKKWLWEDKILYSGQTWRSGCERIKYYTVDKHEEVVVRGKNIIQWTNMKKWLGEDKILYNGQTWRSGCERIRYYTVDKHEEVVVRG